MVSLARFIELHNENRDWYEDPYLDIAYDDAESAGRRLALSITRRLPFYYFTFPIAPLTIPELFEGLSETMRSLALRFLKAFCLHHSIDTMRESPLLDCGVDMEEYDDDLGMDSDAYRHYFGSSEVLSSFEALEAGDIIADLMAYTPLPCEIYLHTVLMDGLPFLAGADLVSISDTDNGYGEPQIEASCRVLVTLENSDDHYVGAVLDALCNDGYETADIYCSTELRSSEKPQLQYEEQLLDYISRLSDAFHRPLVAE